MSDVNRHEITVTGEVHIMLRRRLRPDRVTVVAFCDDGFRFTRWGLCIDAPPSLCSLCVAAVRIPAAERHQWNGFTELVERIFAADVDADYEREFLLDSFDIPVDPTVYRTEPFLNRDRVDPTDSVAIALLSPGIPRIVDLDLLAEPCENHPLRGAGSPPPNPVSECDRMADFFRTPTRDWLAR